jgi:hypothetical protein
VDDVGFGNA